MIQCKDYYKLLRLKKEIFLLLSEREWLRLLIIYQTAKKH